MKTIPLCVSLGIIYLIVFFDCNGVSMIVPILPKYSDKFGSSSFIHGITFIAYPTTGFFSTMIMGWLSDKYGRKPLLVASIVGSCLGAIFQFLANKHWEFILARCFTGALGGSMTVASSYIADVFDPNDRPKQQARLSGVISLSYLIGPVIGSFLGDVELNLPLYFITGCAGLVLIIVVFFLPDSKEYTKNKNDQNTELTEVKKVEESNSTKTETEKEKEKEIEVEKPLEKKESSSTTPEVLNKPEETTAAIAKEEEEEKPPEVIDASITITIDESQNRQSEKLVSESDLSPTNNNGVDNITTMMVPKEVSSTRSSYISTENNNINKHNKKTTASDPKEERKNKISLTLIFFECFFLVSSLMAQDIGFPVFAEKQLKISTTISGIFFSSFGLFFIIFEWFLFDIIRRYISLPTILVSGTIVQAIGWLFVGFIKNNVCSYIGFYIMGSGSALCYCLPAIIISLLSKPEVQGKNIGICQGFDGSARIFPPLFYAALFDVNYYVPFELAMGLSCIALCFAIAFYCVNGNNPKLAAKNKVKH